MLEGHQINPPTKGWKYYHINEAPELLDTMSLTRANHLKVQSDLLIRSNK